ncbi:tumor necrosis factor ligand superfamily member 4-like [Rhineura floridana]|uniref:tumor necrosis factor ligand superfamily member 4-like n=1 Tax=Rhineura floridana TaxID=261503 RepID=UPI002AC86214|nr:tumor necrosis factor ligand superfamily member 4-like [Rhineura floridana]
MIRGGKCGPSVEKPKREDMEQLEMEARRLEEAPAEGEDGKRTRRISLQLGGMVVQWMVLFACLIWIGLCYLRSPDPQTQWIYIKPSNHSIVYKKPIGIKKKDGTMEINVLNHSIPIHCDGLYLFFLKGTITLQRAKDGLILRVYYQPKQHFLKVNCSDQNTEVREVIVREFRSKDEVYLEADSNDDENHEAPKQDLTLSLIMLTPRSYCYPEN